MKKQSDIKQESNSFSNLSKRLREALERFDKSPEEVELNKKIVLKNRANELSKIIAEEKEGDSFEYIQFGLANEFYGIEKIFAKEIFPLKDLTQLPCVPDFIVGIINVRGKIISVIDLKKFFDLPDTGISELNRVIILEDSQLEFGILADKIYGVKKVYLDEIQKSLPTLKGIKEEYLKGITDDRVVILDQKKILSDNRIIVNEQV